jgi:uncharacterized protein (TIGR02001 family)
MSFRSCLGGAVVCFGVLASAHALANDPLVKEDAIPGEFSANVALTSEYFFRGISQSDDIPALQGGFDYSVGLTEGIGLYAGVWGSNVNFTDARLELDFYGGLQGEIRGFSWSAGLIQYWYPGAGDNRQYDFWEAAFTLGYDFGVAAATGSINYSPDYYAGSGDAVYYALGVDVPIGKYLTLSGHVGHQDIDNNTAFGTPDYTDYSIGASVNIIGFDVSVAWQDTDMSDSECFTTGDLCGAATLTVSRSF